jgi:hypothetical protein
MIVMKFGGASVQDAQAIDRVAAIVRENLEECPAPTSALANALAPDNDPAPQARKSLAHPEASNAKPEGWVGHRMKSSPVGATQESHAPCLTANKPLSPRVRPTTRQESGHEFTRAVQPQKDAGFSPCQKTPQGLKAKFFLPYTARLKSCPDTCLGLESAIVPFNNASPNVVLRASVSPWWILCEVRR